MAAPIQIQEMTKFPKGVSSFGIPVLPGMRPTTGRVFFVDSTAAQKGDDLNHGIDPYTPFATLDFAIGSCGANRGDTICVLQGHTESIVTLAGINCDVAGITIIGFGEGRARPKFTFSTTVNASLAINAANVAIYNCVWDFTGVDAIVAGIDVNISDFSFRFNDVTFASAVGQAGKIVLTDANCDRMQISDNNFIGSDDDGTATVIEIADGAVDIIIARNRIRGSFSVAAVYVAPGPTTAAKNLSIEDNFIVTKLTGVGPDQKCIYINDLATGQLLRNVCIGTSLAVLISSAGSLMAPVLNYGYDGDTTGTVGIDIPPIGGQLGVGRSLIDEIIGAQFSYNRANSGIVVVSFASATWNTVATHEVLTVTGTVRLRILPICSADLTSGGAGTLSLGDETAAASMIAATLATDIDNGESWLTATPAVNYNASQIIDKIISGGKDVGFLLGTAALTGGTLNFYYWWEPISIDGNVVAGAGGPL